MRSQTISEQARRLAKDVSEARNKSDGSSAHAPEANKPEEKVCLYQVLQQPATECFARIFTESIKVRLSTKLPYCRALRWCACCLVRTHGQSLNAHMHKTRDARERPVPDLCAGLNKCCTNASLRASICTHVRVIQCNMISYHEYILQCNTIQRRDIKSK
jgi:hypothetical protein